MYVCTHIVSFVGRCACLTTYYNIAILNSQLYTYIRKVAYSIIICIHQHMHNQQVLRFVYHFYLNYTPITHDYTVNNNIIALEKKINIKKKKETYILNCYLSVHTCNKYE